MNKDLLVKLRVEKRSFTGLWDVMIISSVRLHNCRELRIMSYRTHIGAIKAAKRLLPLFVNAVLEE